MTKHQSIHVSPLGNDQNIGTPEKPFRTLNRAREAVREINRLMEEDIHVYLHGGTYQLTETFRLYAEDSGFNGHSVIYTSYPGEQAMLSGGITVSGWVKDNDANSCNLWKTSLPELSYTRHLYRDGNLLPRTASEVKESHGWELMKDENMEFWNPLETVLTLQGDTVTVYAGYRTTNKDMASWINPMDIEFVFDVGWTHSICPVDSIQQDGDGAVIRMRMPCFRDCQIKEGVRIGTPNYIENAYKLMDEPQEWYFDRASRTLYYFAEEEENPNDSTFTVPVIEQLVWIQGDLDRRVRNITFDNLDFRDTTWLRPSVEGFAEVQALMVKEYSNENAVYDQFIKSSSAVQLDAAESITLTGCTFSRLGNSGLDIHKGSRSNRVIGNVFTSISGSGVQVGGFSLTDAHPQSEEGIVRDNRIENNVFHDIGMEYKGSIAVAAGYTEGTVVAHNEIAQCSYTGISVGWGWGYSDPGSETRYVDPVPADYPRFSKPSIARANRIEYNHVHHVLEKLHDGGGIYTLSMQPGSTIKGNYIHDNGNKSGKICKEGLLVGISANEEERQKYHEYSSSPGFPGGIYMDEATGGFEVTGNIIHGVVAPIHYHQVMDHRFETNAIHDNLFNICPDDSAFPAEMTAEAGLESAYRHLLARKI